MKICTKCKEEKELTEFYRSKTRKSGLREDCKECTKEQNYTYSQTKDGYISKRACKLRERGCEITNEELVILLSTHKECEICGSIDNLCVDHCHEGNHVRGMLCNHCNTALGKFKDNIKTLQKAIEYLKAHSALSE